LLVDDACLHKVLMDIQTGIIHFYHLSRALLRRPFST
jgi:hypothetical protein